MNDVTDFRYVSKKRRVKEDKRFVTGRGKFAADINLPGMLHVAMVSSPYACARIKSIRTDHALALPGVHTCLPGTSSPGISTRCCRASTSPM